MIRSTTTFFILGLWVGHGLACVKKNKRKRYRRVKQKESVEQFYRTVTIYYNIL